jgi:hypothetical protein
MQTVKLSAGTVKRFASLADRCHVGETFEETLAYAKTRLAPGAWASLSAADRIRLERALWKRRDENRRLYASVMRGI